MLTRYLGLVFGFSRNRRATFWSCSNRGLVFLARLPDGFVAPLAVVKSELLKRVHAPRIMGWARPSSVPVISNREAWQCPILGHPDNLLPQRLPAARCHLDQHAR